MTDTGLKSWRDELSARDRVREIATTLTRPRSVDWVREQAGVSAWQTAKDELEMLVDFGQLHAIDDNGHTKYAPNYQHRYISEVTDLINGHTREELREEIAAIQETIDDWRAEYGVESRDDLEATLTGGELSSEDIRERNAVLREWERHEDNKRLLRHALELYEDARALYPGSDGDDPSASSLPLS